MFAAGDKVFYTGKGILERDVPYRVNRVVNTFLYVEGHEARYRVTSFTNAPPDLLEKLTEKVNNEGVGVCSYALEFDEGHQRFQIRDVCHARLSYGDRYSALDEQKQNLKAVALNVSGYFKVLPKEWHEAYKLHVKYIITESPWRDAFIQAPMGEIYASGVYLDITKNFSYCVAAAIALRSGSEFKARLPLFKSLIDLQYSPHVAYIVSQFTTYPEKFTAFGGGHHVMGNTNVTLQNMAKFFNTDKFNNDGMKYKDAKGRSYRIFPLIGETKGNEVSMYNDILQRLGHIVTTVKNGWGPATKYIDYTKRDNLIMVANTIAKEVK